LDARYFRRSKEYSVEWIVRRIREENESKTVKILKIQTYFSQEDNYLITLVQKLNLLTDSDVILALKAMKIETATRY